MEEELVSYLITDPQYYTNDKVTFEKKLQEVLSNKNINMACFRDKLSSNFEELAEVFVRVCKNNKIETILINGDYNLAKKLGANGVHLTSNQFDEIKEAKKLDLYTIISCHNYNDIDEAMDNHINAIVYSPIFESPGKGEAKGVGKLKEAVGIYEDLDIIALGGIVSQKEILQVKSTKAYGFASIRYFI